jgi:hypothetical protein
MPNELHGDDSEVILVGDLNVEVGQQRVTRAGLEITLPNLSFELLLALIRVAPNFLCNDLLMARVWPGQIVTPETVAKRVNLLRVALGDSAQEQLLTSHGCQITFRLSASVAFYRAQATLFAGRSDGKFGATRKEVSCFHMLTGAEEIEWE